MRLAAAALLTVIGAILAMAYPATTVFALLVCGLSWLLLSWFALNHRTNESLRHAAIAASAFLAIALLIVVLILAVPGGLDPATRERIRVLVLAAATFPATYWLILLGTGGFDER